MPAPAVEIAHSSLAHREVTSTGGGGVRGENFKCTSVCLVCAELHLVQLTTLEGSAGKRKPVS